MRGNRFPVIGRFQISQFLDVFDVKFEVATGAADVGFEVEELEIVKDFLLTLEVEEQDAVIGPHAGVE